MYAPPPGRNTLRRLALLGTTALFLIATGVGFAGQPAHSEFADGTLAYQEGDYERAYNEWLPLARAGNAAAQRNIGQLYRLGLGVPKDLKVAANWYRLAADQGLSRAQANLGVMYLRGEGVERDPVKAAEWFSKAADQGHVISQYNLALMLEQGYGVTRNLREAAKWFAEASDGGHEKAGDRLASILSESVAPATGGPAGAHGDSGGADSNGAGPRLSADAYSQSPKTCADLATGPSGCRRNHGADVRRVRNRQRPAYRGSHRPAVPGGHRRHPGGTPRGAPRRRAAHAGCHPTRDRAGGERPASSRLPEGTQKARREDAPVQAALGGASEARRSVAPAPQARSAPPVRSSTVRPIIEVPVAPFLKAEAAASRQPSPPVAKPPPAPS